jgi:EpsI family protein
VRSLLVPLFLAVQAAAVWLVVGVEHPPPIPDLSTFPVELGDWKRQAEDTTAAAIMSSSKADGLLSRFYVHRDSGITAHLLVAWYQSQRAGDRQPHQPDICLLGSGWIPVSRSRAKIDTPVGAVDANQYLISKRSERSAIVYWYQTPRRTIASEWESKAWLVMDSMRDQRTDAALVRIVVSGARGDAVAFQSANSFAKAAYPALRELLPH